MEVSFIHDLVGLDALADDWDRLLPRAGTVVPFLRHDFQRIWWSTLGGGEWPGGDLWIGVGRGASGEVQGIAPLFWGEAPGKTPALRLLGSVEIADYLDLVVPADQADSLAAATFEALERRGPDGWTCLDLFNLPEGSPSLAALERAAAKRGWSCTRQRLQPCPVIHLDSDWDAYLGRLDKKQRHELRRKLRRAEAGPEAVEIRITEPGDGVSAAIDDFLRLMAIDSHKAAFLTPRMRTYFTELIRTGLAGGWVQLAFLDVAGRTAAAYLNFDFAGRIWVYNSGLDPAYQALSPGWVLIGRLIEWAIQNGRREFDFLRGGEDYKFRLGGIERSIYRLTVTR